jgi:hypothetical protein
MSSQKEAAPSHPIKLSRPKAADFAIVEETSCEDSQWHFKAAVRWPCVVGPAPGTAPAVGAPQRLAWYRRESPLVDIEVVGHLLEREVDAADFLDEELAAMDGVKVVSRRPVALKGGAAGDVVATWERDGKAFAGRFFATKWGARVFVVSARAALEDYEAIAEDFFTTLATFEPIHDLEGMFAERVVKVSHKVPLKWEAVIPDAWMVLPAYEDERIAGFQAVSVEGFDIKTVYGRISFAVADRSAAKKPREAANLFLDVVRENGFELLSEEFTEEPAQKPFERSWVLASKLVQGDRRGELRCRVMMHPSVWAIGGVLGPSEGDDRASWMENKRALDVVTSTLRLV